MKILLDTSALIALQVASDIHHQSVKSYLDQQSQRGARFFTTDYVIDELLTRILYDFGHQAAQKSLDSLRQQSTQQSLSIISISQDLFSYSLSEFEKLSNRKLSFTDVTLAVVFSRYKFDEICSLDRGFAAAGLTLSPLISI